MSLPTFKRGDRPSDWRADELNELVRLVRENLPITAGPGLRVGSSTSRGKCISLVGLPGVESPVAPSGAVQQFRITDPNFLDTILAEPWDGTTATGEAVHIAKPPLLRMGLLSSPGYVLNGARFSVAGADTLVATQVSLPSYTESWTVGPSYFRVGESAPETIIYAVKVDSTGVSVGGEPITWLDLNVDGRQWMFSLPGAASFVRSKFFIAVGRVG